MNTHFVFVNNSWWDSPPCDCCQGGLVESYLCVSHEKPEYSCSSIDDIEKELLFAVAGIDVNEIVFSHWLEEEAYIKEQLLKHNITYEIEEN